MNKVNIVLEIDIPDCDEKTFRICGVFEDKEDANECIKSEYKAMLDNDLVPYPNESRLEELKDLAIKNEVVSSYHSLLVWSYDVVPKSNGSC